MPRLGAVKPAKARNGLRRLAPSLPTRCWPARGDQAGMSGADEPAEPGVASSSSSWSAALTPAQRRRRIAFKVAAVLSLLLHAGSLDAFLTWHGADTGAIEQPSDAISVEIVESRTLEALQPQQIPEPAPSPEATAPIEGKTEASDAPRGQVRAGAGAGDRRAAAAALVVPDAPEEVERTAKAGDAGQVGGAAGSGRRAAEVVPPPPKAGSPTRTPRQSARKQKKIEKKKAAERAPKGGVTSKSSAGKGKGGERASASSGSMLSYAAHVRARVAGNKPSGGGLRGTAVVSFGVTTSGGLAYASVARSSGSSTLDQLAVAAVRGSAPFPTPPARGNVGAAAVHDPVSLPVTGRNCLQSCSQCATVVVGFELRSCAIPVAGLGWRLWQKSDTCLAFELKSRVHAHAGALST